MYYNRVNDSGRVMDGHIILESWGEGVTLFSILLKREGSKKVFKFQFKTFAISENSNSEIFFFRHHRVDVGPHEGCNAPWV